MKFSNAPKCGSYIMEGYRVWEYERCSLKCEDSSHFRRVPYVPKPRVRIRFIKMIEGKEDKKGETY